MRKLACLVVIACSCLSAADAATAYHSPEGQFTAEFPTGPIQTGLYRGKTAKGISYYEYLWSLTNQEGYWGVAIFSYAQTFKGDYDANIRAAVAGAKGRLASQKTVQQNGVEGREIVIEGPKSVIVRERILWINGRLYWITFSSAKAGVANTPAVDRFLNSFETDFKQEKTAAAKGQHSDNFDTWSKCMGGGRPEIAVKECTALIDSGRELPENLPYANVYRGKAELALSQNDAAFQDFTAALKFDPPLAHAYYGLGQVYRAREDWAHAADAFGKAAASQSEDADIDAFTADAEGTFRADSLAEHGYALFKGGDLKQPLADFDAAAKGCLTCSAPFRYKALVLDALQKSAEAMAAADRAIALDVRSGSAFFVRGVIKARSGRTEQAIADYDEALRLTPNLDLAMKARASAFARLHKQGDPSAERRAAAKALAAPVLDEAALTRLFSAKTWQARQGPWLARLEFRGDGTFRQHLKDTSEGSALEVTQDGVWGVSRGELCIYTNVDLCLSAHASDGEIVLARGDRAADANAVEYSGAAVDLKNLAIDASTDPVAEFPVEEVLLKAPAGAPKGPRTLFYYMHGFDGHAREHSPLPEYFVSEIQNSRGWDVIDGNYPRSGVTEIRRSGGANFGAAVYLARRLKELKAQGYQRIYVGGQSWGGWTSLDLATMPGLPLDGVVLVVPACCGWRPTGAAHDDHGYANNKIFFDQMIARVHYPTVGVFFLGDEYEPADRGAGAATTLASYHVPNLIIDHPPGFSGHGSAWFPPFDYEYGACIANFLEAPRSGYCPRQQISIPGQDFRSILVEAQLASRNARTAKLADVSGKQFAVYPDGVLSKIVSSDKTEVKGYGIGNSTLASSFRGDLYCVRGRVKYNQPENTDEVCSRLVQWSDHELLAIDPQDGTVLQWWVERP